MSKTSLDWNQSKNGLPWPYNTLLVLKNHKLLYVPIAKNACSSLKRLCAELCDLPTKREMLAEGDLHTFLWLNQTGLSLEDFPPEEAEAILGDPSYFRFIVLRDPFDRLASAYLQKFVKGPPDDTAPVVEPVVRWVYAARGEAPDYDRSVTFREFVEYLEQSPDSALDTHWKPQVNYLGDLRFDYIGRVEQLANLKRILDVVTEMDIQFHRINTVEKSTGPGRGLRFSSMLPAQIRALDTYPSSAELISVDLAERIRGRFRDDLALYENEFGVASTRFPARARYLAA